MTKRKRGRPTVAQTRYGDYSTTMETVVNDGRFKSKRSTADYVYCIAALRIIQEADTKIPYIETICKVN